MLGDHSVAKHDIFEQYVRIYIERLTRTPSQTMLNLTIVDGFSGGGLYRLRGRKVDGSPLRLLRAVEAADHTLKAARAKGFSVRADFFFVDENAEHIAFLGDLLVRRGYGPRIGQDIFVKCSQFEDACPAILRHIQTKGTAHRSLFFLDQYGWSDVRLATIRTILGALKNPEILLTFSVDALIDFLSVKTAEAQALMNIELAREDVRALMGMRNGDGWRYLIQNGLTGMSKPGQGRASTHPSSSARLKIIGHIGCCTCQITARHGTRWASSIGDSTIISSIMAERASTRWGSTRPRISGRAC
jgi:three-Cys-motif partner protein